MLRRWWTSVSDVLAEILGSTGFVRLNRPHRGNSVTPKVVTELGETVQSFCDTDTVRSVVLTGTGRVFCAGADVQEMNSVYVADGADGLASYLADVWMPAVQRTVRVIWGAPKPVVAALNGAATAGGLDFGLACDVRVASTNARFAESYVNLGMVPVAGGAYLLPLIAGLSAATELLASGQLINAERAHALGLVDQLCSPDELETRAIELATKLVHGPAETFARLKQIVRGPRTADFNSALQESYEANVSLIRRDDVMSQIVAVMQRYSKEESTG